MNNRKKTYYISVGATGEIMSVPNASPWQFKIEATDDEIRQLRSIYNANYNNSIADFLRAHVPYVEYHNDSTNDRNDSNLNKIYGMIYDLGDEEARNHIETMGVLDGEKNDFQ